MSRAAPAGGAESTHHWRLLSIAPFGSNNDGFVEISSDEFAWHALRSPRVRREALLLRGW